MRAYGKDDGRGNTGLAIPITSLGPGIEGGSTFDSNGVVEFPRRCVTCASRELDEPALIELTCESVVGYRLEGSEIKGRLTKFSRTNRARFRIPLCGDHGPRRSGLGTAGRRVDGLRIEFPRVLEPRTSQFFAGKWERNAKGFLEHPVMHFEFGIVDDSYRGDFNDANQRWISELRGLSWNEFQEDLDMGVDGPIVMGIAKRWSDRADRWVHFDRMNSMVDFQLADSPLMVDWSVVARIRHGSFFSAGKEEPPTLWIFNRKLSKTHGFDRDDSDALSQACQRYLPDETEVKKKTTLCRLSSAESVMISELLEWISERIDQRRALSS